MVNLYHRFKVQNVMRVRFLNIEFTSLSVCPSGNKRGVFLHNAVLMTWLLPQETRVLHYQMLSPACVMLLYEDGSGC